MALLPSGYVPNYSLDAADTGYGFPYASTAVGSRAIYTEGVLHPVTEQTIEGWKWDLKSFIGDNSSTYDTSIPLIYDALTSGITSSYFQTGIGCGKDLEHVETQQLTLSGISGAGYWERAWVPVIHRGDFYEEAANCYLHADDSETHNLSLTGLVSGLPVNLNCLQLQFRPKIGVPITARQYKWESSYQRYEPLFTIRQKCYFTGLLDSNLERLETYNEDQEAWLYHNIDNTNPEFVLTYSGEIPQLLFNDQFVELVGDIATVSGLELLGYSTGAQGQQFHLQYAPIDITAPVRIFSWLNPAAATEWTTVSGMAHSLVGNEVGIDYNLGLVEFPSASGNILPVGHSIGASYYKSVAIEYDPEDATDYATAFDANVNPVQNYSEQGFLYLTHNAEQPASITLAAKLATISTGVYGPLYMGNNFATLEAAVLDELGEAIENIPVTFEIIGTPKVGNFGGVLTTTESITDSSGKAYAFYRPPRTSSDVSKEVDAADITIDPVAQTTTLHIDNYLLNSTISEIFLFSVYTDDALVGWNDPTLAQDEETQLNAYYTNFFTEHQIWGPVGLQAPGVIGSFARTWEELRRQAWGLSTPLIWEAVAGKGRKLLVAVEDLSGASLDPHLFTPGAVIPFQPTQIIDLGGNAYDLVYDTSTYTLPALGGYLQRYLVVSPTNVTIRAYYYSVRTQQYIYSNTIDIKITVPASMNGLWIVQSLNEVDRSEISSILAAMSASDLVGKKIPLGFRIRSSSVTLAGALGGVVFLDVNRSSNQDVWPPLRHKFTVV